jgi:outer membrane putative beta-barrel porin/alpha-amylase
MTRLALVVVLLLPLAAAAGESAEPISPDRAGASTSTDTVGRGAVQVESGLAYLHESVGGEPAERRFRVEAGLRAGVTERLELRLEGLPLVRLRGAEDETGLGEIFVLAKYRFVDAADEWWRPALGVLPFVKLPVSEEPLGSGKTDFGAILLASFALPGQVSLDLNAGLAAVGQSRPGGYLVQALAAAGASRDVADGLTLFTELVYTSRDERDGRDSLLVDLGAIWRPTPTVALDASAVTSLAGRGPDWALRAGVSVRFGR